MLPNPTTPLAIWMQIRIDNKITRLGKITSEERAKTEPVNPYAMENNADPKLLPGWFTEILHPDLIFPFKNCHGWTKPLELVLGHHESIFSPDSWLFWVKHLFFLWHFPFELLAFGHWAVKPEFSDNFNEVCLYFSVQKLVINHWVDQPTANWRNIENFTCNETPEISYLSKIFVNQIFCCMCWSQKYCFLKYYCR